MRYEIEKTTENYDPNILLPIWEDSLSELDRRRIKWSYEGNPKGQAQLWLLRDPSKQKYFGSCAVLPRVFQYKGRELIGGITADFAIKKEYRTLGPALKLQRSVAASEDFEMLLGFPNPNSEGVQLRAGFRPLGSLTRFIKIFRSSPVLKRRYNPTLSRLAAPFADIYFILKSTGLKSRFSNVQYYIGENFNRKHDNIWESAKEQFSFIGKKDSQYLIWRYAHNPYKAYYIFHVEDRNRHLIGYLIYYIHENIVYIDDFFFSPPELNLKSMIDSFSFYCRKSKFDAMSLTMLANPIIIKFLKKTGFIFETTKQNVLFFCKERESINGRDIFLTSGDCDF